MKKRRITRRRRRRKKGTKTTRNKERRWRRNLKRRRRKWEEVGEGKGEIKREEEGHGLKVRLMPGICFVCLFVCKAASPLVWTIQSFTLKHCTALHCTALHCTTLHCTALHCTAIHCTALHCPVLQFRTLQIRRLDSTTLHVEQYTWAVDQAAIPPCLLSTAAYAAEMGKYIVKYQTDWV